MSSILPPCQPDTGASPAVCCSLLPMLRCGQCTQIAAACPCQKVPAGRNQSTSCWKGHKSPSGWREEKVTWGILPINAPRLKPQYQPDMRGMETTNSLHVPHKARKALSLPLHRSSTQDTFILKLLPTTRLWQASFLNPEWYTRQPEYQKTGLKIQRMWHWRCARQQAQF